MKLRECFWSLMMMLGAVRPAYAQPSLGLDPNFRPSITKPEGAIHGVAIQADGKIIPTPFVESLSRCPRTIRA